MIALTSFCSFKGDCEKKNLRGHRSQENVIVVIMFQLLTIHVRYFEIYPINKPLYVIENSTAC
jgi:hypothetical protein